MCTYTMINKYVTVSDRNVKDNNIYVDIKTLAFWLIKLISY